MIRARMHSRSGITLLEVTVTFAFLAVVILGVSSAVSQGLRTTRDLRERQLVKVRSQIYLNRVMSLNFGQATDPAPSAAQIEELFDDDSAAGTATLTALTRAPGGDGGWKFRLARFPVDGIWLVSVSNDLDGDGDVDTDLEKSGSLVRIAVAFNGQRVLETVRGRETQA